MLRSSVDQVMTSFKLRSTPALPSLLDEAAHFFLARLADLLHGPSIPYPDPDTGVTRHSTLRGFYVSTGDSNSGPHACTAGTLLTISQNCKVMLVFET